MENRELERYLEEEFIPRYVELKKDKEDPEEMFPHLQLHRIQKLNLSEEDFKEVMNYLSERGIHVSGRDTAIEGEFENYDTRKISSLFPESLKPEETLEKFKALEITKDPVIREQIIVGNLRLACYFTWNMAALYGMDKKELETYAFEGLIHAVDTFDLSKGVKFSTHAYHYINRFIMSGIYESNNFKQGEYKFFSAIREIEDINGQTIYENPELVDDVVDTLIARGDISAKNADLNKRRIMMLKYLSTDFVDEAIKDNVVSIGENYETPEDIVVEELAKESVQEFFSQANLNETERKVLTLYYGENKTFAEIGEIIGMSRQGAHQAKDSALNKLRLELSKPVIKKKLEDIVFPKKEGFKKRDVDLKQVDSKEENKKVK